MHFGKFKNLSLNLIEVRQCLLICLFYPSFVEFLKEGLNRLTE